MKKFLFTLVAVASIQAYSNLAKAERNCASLHLACKATRDRIDCLRAELCEASRPLPGLRPPEDFCAAYPDVEHCVKQREQAREREREKVREYCQRYSMDCVNL